MHSKLPPETVLPVEIDPLLSRKAIKVPTSLVPNPAVALPTCEVEGADEGKFVKLLPFIAGKVPLKSAASKFVKLLALSAGKVPDNLPHLNLLMN